MVYQDIFNYTNSTGATGITGVFGYVATSFPVFFPFVLFCIWLIIMLGSYFSEKRLNGIGDIMSSFAVSSVITFVLSSILYLMISPSLIDPITWIVTLIFAVIGVASMFTSNER